MMNFHERYRVRVRPVPGKPVPAHPMVQNVIADPEGYFNFPFIHRRPRFPNKTEPGKCRYVEDFVDVYGAENVRVEKMGALNEDWLASIMRASHADTDSKE